MNAFVLFAIAAALCAVGQAKTCNEPGSDDALLYLGLYGEHMLRYFSLDKDVCGNFTFDKSKKVYTFTPTKTAYEASKYKLERKHGEGSGYLTRKDLKTEESEPYVLFDCGADGNDETWSCFFTCTGEGDEKTKGFDCYLSSKGQIEYVNKAIKKANLDGVKTHYCKDIK